VGDVTGISFTFLSFFLISADLACSYYFKEETNRFMIYVHIECNSELAKGAIERGGVPGSCGVVGSTARPVRADQVKRQPFVFDDIFAKGYDN
jgi:hypothetical protein